MEALWLSNPQDSESDFQSYQFYLGPSSPIMLNAALHHHLGEFRSPAALDMRSIMKQAYFILRVWASNSVQALAIKGGVTDKDTTVNLLGLQWNILPTLKSLLQIVHKQMYWIPTKLQSTLALNMFSQRSKWIFLIKVHTLYSIVEPEYIVDYLVG